MSKRAASVTFEESGQSKKSDKKEGKKHSLDSDEEDSAAEEEQQNVLNADDIEGEEDGTGGMEGEITITPFNMKEELEEGHFDTEGHYHWKKEKEIRDGWLDNIDWVKVKGRPEDKYKIFKDEQSTSKGIFDDSDSDEEQPDEKYDIIANYQEIILFMKPKETIAKTLQRLGANSKISSAERWKRKKAGIVDESSKSVTRITELANQILTKEGNMDIYQETYEKISDILAKEKFKKDDAQLDMYADDFDEKEKTTIDKKDQGETKESSDKDETQVLKWEFKWTQDNNAEISGPHTTEQMQKWVVEGYFKTGVWARKCGEDTQFYSSNRIDFELYM
ncbi:CD2 antigen cytoplasmic tail-binding protein 2 homolog [Pararge aegeria]|uniref:Jg15381 protein n=3 Tax=Pararge aegeria TaxID=116150 RepID=A0A8S4SGF4_9NEOP|nr:CD2 antigen cytoplasmic tail-binding protein 2 homolog [Pararge aegeria]CAH2254795.1 jg15381 [Pararge aegeria aegeria]